jgi:tRNA modification GTPase
LQRLSTDAHEDTIAAAATAVGGGVAIVRVSGSEARAIAEKLFRPKNAMAGFLPRQMVYGSLVSTSGDALDDCILTWMPRPHSFTGEDVIEIHCHGGHAVVRSALDACMEAGARLAEPGEFSRRAFLNGKMDLSQAEALGDLIAAQTDLARRAALQQLRGGLSAEVRAVRASLIDAAAEIEAHLDFPEEDIPALAQERIVGIMTNARTAIERLLAGFARGRLVRDGARVVLAGKPNAGKSSLFNAIIGRERAIVSPHPGTTRDTIESTVDIAGVPVTLIDTAGLREARDEVEQIGIARTSEEMRGADIIVHVLDATVVGDTVTGAEMDETDPAGATVVRVYNKADMVASTNRLPDDALLVSATQRHGIDALLSKISSLLAPSDSGTHLLLTRARHAECLRKALASLARASAGFARGDSGDLVMVDLRDCLIDLGEIIGERLDEQILDRIFSTFCLGK